VSGEQIKDAILTKQVPYCPRCSCSTSESDNEDGIDGVMKPDIVFFGEKLPSEFDRCFSLDREKVDLLIVMGSSLKVAPVSEIMGMQFSLHIGGKSRIVT
jgi:NAD-dependent SIR2 family protein deacetylase